MAEDLFKLDELPLKYFLIYKCSQDNLEIFFSCLRRKEGWKNNLNASQLRWSSMQLLFRNNVNGSTASNCIDYLLVENADKI